MPVVGASLVAEKVGKQRKYTYIAHGITVLDLLCRLREVPASFCYPSGCTPSIATVKSYSAPRRHPPSNPHSEWAGGQPVDSSECLRGKCLVSAGTAARRTCLSLWRPHFRCRFRECRCFGLGIGPGGPESFSPTCKGACGVAEECRRGTRSNSEAIWSLERLYIQTCSQMGATRRWNELK